MKYLVITVARKPCSAQEGGTVAANALRWGTGGINIDGSRITTQEKLQGGAGGLLSNVRDGKEWGHHAGPDDNGFRQSPFGRWPANLILQHKSGCQRVGEKKVRSSNHSYREEEKGGTNHVYGGGRPARPTDREIGYASPDGTETVAAWECEHGCSVVDLDAQSGVLTSGQPSGVRHEGGNLLAGGGNLHPLTGFGDTGGASRFFKQVGGQK